MPSIIIDIDNLAALSVGDKLMKPTYIYNIRLPLPNVNDNAYTRNKRVINVEKLHPQIVCPKSLALDEQGKLYTGTVDGGVYCVQNDSTLRIITNFDKGRPLGMRISSKNVLYFIEANSGLYSYDLQSSELKHLLGTVMIRK